MKHTLIYYFFLSVVFFSFDSRTVPWRFRDVYARAWTWRRRGLYFKKKNSEFVRLNSLIYEKNPMSFQSVDA